MNQLFKTPKDYVHGVPMLHDPKKTQDTALTRVEASKNQGGLQTMKSIHTMMSAAALSTLAFVAFAAPAAQASEYCGVDDSGMRGCGYATLEQCLVTLSGRHGTCMRDPFYDDASAKLKGVSNALAYQPKHGRAHKHRATQ
jgi:hypothetical protein